VGIINNNYGKGQKQSRYNYCDNTGCTEVNKFCKFVMKTNLKLAYEEDLHTTPSNLGLTLRIRAYN